MHRSGSALARVHMLQRLQKQKPQKEDKDVGDEYMEPRIHRFKKLSSPVPAKRRCGGRKAVIAAAATTTQEEAGESLGENMLELETMERSARETTPCGPCSLICLETISTPGSTTSPIHSSHHRVLTPMRTISISKELNEVLTAARRQLAFIDKYNFDPVNDCPLPGRYEWVKLH